MKRITAAVLLLPLLMAATPARDAERWTPAWVSPPIAYEPDSRDGKGVGRPFRDETVRQEVRAGIAGRTLRVRLTNELSDASLTIGAASIVRLDADGRPIPGTVQPLSFAGARAAVIPARAPMVSDPLPLAVRAGERLAVAIHYPGEAAPPAHAQMVDVAAGNLTDQSDWPQSRRLRGSGLVSALEVSGSAATRVLVALGDSITEGAGATAGKAMSWPDQLGRMLATSPGGRCWAIANAGISGNRLLSTGRGPAALARFDRDVLAVPGVSHLVLLEGINDIGKVRDPKDRQPSAAELIVAYQQLLARAQAHGLNVIVGTLLPFEGATYADAAGEERRETVNRWIRANRSRFAGVIDFDSAMGEPGKPTIMRLTDQIGDHLHPNDAGYTRMAKTALPVVLAQGC